MSEQMSDLREAHDLWKDTAGLWEDTAKNYKKAAKAWEAATKIQWWLIMALAIALVFVVARSA